MKKIFVLINLISVILVGCSNTLESNEMEVSVAMYEIDEDGNEILLEPVITSSEYIVEKTFYIRDLLYELEVDLLTLCLTENDDDTVSFEIACSGDDIKSQVDKMLKIISDNLENVDFDNSRIIDYGLLETDPDNAVVYGERYIPEESFVSEKVDNYETPVEEVYVNDYLTEKSKEIEKLLNEIDVEVEDLFLIENENDTITFALFCIGLDSNNESTINEILSIISDNIDNVDVYNSIIADYDLFGNGTSSSIIYP